MSSKRRIFIGDIQGCREELEELLEAVSFDPTSDELHPVGDLVNRGPDSAGTLRLLQSLNAGGVLGNHDLHLPAAPPGRREASRRDTFADIFEADDRDELLAWLAARPFARGWEDILCVHAGLDPTWPDPVEEHLADLDPHDPDERAGFVTRVRYCAKDGRLPDSDDPPPGAPFPPWLAHARARPPARPPPTPGARCAATAGLPQVGSSARHHRVFEGESRMQSWSLPLTDGLRFAVGGLRRVSVLVTMRPATKPPKEGKLRDAERAV